MKHNGDRLNSVKRWKRMVLLAVYCIAFNATASEVALKDVDVPLNNETFRAGAKVFTTVCVACHSLKYIKYRNLLEIGFTEQQVDTMRGDKKLNDFIDRLTPADALAASFGKAPPDLSMMAKSRVGEARYIYSLLTGYYIKDDGTPDNHVFPGIRMPDPLGYTGTEGEARQAVEDQVLKVSSFLFWAADPHVLRRQAIGYWVLGYLILFTVLLYLLKKRYWKKVGAGSTISL